jgi:hypothetical protein
MGLSQGKSLTELEKEIWTCEQRLQALRNDYRARTGHMPTRSLNDSSWKWSIFMCLGFAFISMIVYLLGISKVGADAGMGIPEFFFNTEIAYFALLTFYVVLAVLMVQSQKLSGYQSMSLILGFWCAHWLIYDWGWYAYEFGVKEITDLSGFWQDLFSSPLLIPNPPYWLFLTIAILGGIMAFYTFTIPRCRKHLIPPIIWLYAGYINASICKTMGLSSPDILIVAIVLVALSFGLMGYFTFLRLKRGLPAWLANFGKAAEGGKKRSWTTNPLGFPLVLAIVGMLLLMHLFLATNPALGLFLGMLPWYFLPTYYILINSTGVAKVQGLKRLLITSILTALFVAFIVIMSLLPIGSLF